MTGVGCEVGEGRTEESWSPLQTEYRRLVREGKLRERGTHGGDEVYRLREVAGDPQFPQSFERADGGRDPGVVEVTPFRAGKEFEGCEGGRLG